MTRKRKIGLLKKAKVAIGSVGYFIFKIYLKISNKKIKVLNPEKTVRYIVNSHKSVARYGDGELLWAMQKRKNGNFEKNSPQLARRLLGILKEPKSNLLICVPNVFDSLNNFTIDSRIYWEGFLIRNGFAVTKLLNPEYRYADTQFTRPYMDAKFKSKYDFNKYFLLIKSIWNKRNVIIVEGKKTRFAVNDDLLANSNIIKRILCPPKNAFESYDQILSKIKEIAQNIDDPIILLALGPTATVLAYDLSDEYQAIDIGHLDVEYKWYKAGAVDKIPLEGTYVSEVHKHFIKEFPKDVLDKYKSEVVASIGG